MHMHAILQPITTDGKPRHGDGRDGEIALDEHDGIVLRAELIVTLPCIQKRFKFVVTSIGRLPAR